MARFDYAASAELYPSKSFFKSRQLQYRRFDTAAEAVRYVIEEMPKELLRGSLLEVEEARFESAQIRALYDAEDYPLDRQQAS
jgi:hypothetical protein